MRRAMIWGSEYWRGTIGALLFKRAHGRAKKHLNRARLHWFFRVATAAVACVMVGAFGMMIVFRVEAQATIEQRVLLTERDTKALVEADNRNEKAITALQVQVSELTKDISRMQGIGMGLTLLGTALALLAVLTRPKEHQHKE